MAVLIPAKAMFAVAAAAIAAGVSSWMFVGSFGTKGLPGCGGGSACDAVTRGRWSKWGRVPVAGIGTAFYILLAVAVIADFHRMPGFNGGVAVAGVMALAMLAAGAAIWFIALQAVVIRRLCMYCMAIHACGLTAAALILSRQWLLGHPHFEISLVIAIAGMALLIGGQLLLTPKTFAIISPSAVVQAEERLPELIPPVAPRKGDYEPTRSRRLSLHAGRVVLDPSEFPIIGSPQAPNLIACLMDYTCAECHHLHRLLFEAIEQYAGQLAVVPILVPLNKSCNPAIDCPQQERAQACA